MLPSSTCLVYLPELQEHPFLRAEPIAAFALNSSKTSSEVRGTALPRFKAAFAIHSIGRQLEVG